jgi:hypothetical protein
LGIPITRNTTYIPGVTEVKSADLNQLQDHVARRVPRLFAEFWGPALDPGLEESGDGAVTLPSGFNSQHKVSIQSGGSANDVHVVRSASILGKMTDLLAFRARFRLVSTGTSRFDLIGYIRTSTLGDALTISRSTDDDDNLHVRIRTSSGVEVFDTGFAPVAGTWYVAEVVANTTGNVTWAIRTEENGADVASGDEDLAGTIDGTDSLLFSVECSALTASGRVLDVDYISALAARAA